MFVRWRVEYLGVPRSGVRTKSSSGSASPLKLSGRLASDKGVFGVIAREGLGLTFSRYFDSKL
jgi:hypothetical protein